MKRSTATLLAGLTMVGPLAIDTYLPSFHAIGRHFNVSQALVQQTLSIYLFAFAFLMLFYGMLSDSFGRRPVILGSLALYVSASLGAALALSFGWLLFFRMLQGVAAGGGTVVTRAVVRDRASGAEAQKIMAYMMMVFGLAPAIAPVLGGWLHVTFGWRAVFFFLCVFGMVMFAACLRGLPESLPVEARQVFHPSVIVANYWKVLQHARFLLMALGMGIAFSGFALYIGSAANFVMNILHLPETAFGWMFIPLVGGMVSGSAISARMASRISPVRKVQLGYALMAASVCLNVGYNLFFTAAVPWAVIPLALYAVGLAITTPSVTLALLDMFPDNRGLAASLQSFLQMLIFALVSGTVAPLLFDSALKLACGCAIGLFLSFTLWTLSRKGGSARG